MGKALAVVVLVIVAAAAAALYLALPPALPDREPPRDRGNQTRDGGNQTRGNQTGDGSPPPNLTYQFGAPFEPPTGTVIHGTGTRADRDEEYFGILGDSKLYPQSRGTYFALNADFDSTNRLDLPALFAAEKQAGRTVEISINIQNIGGVMQDTAIATTAAYDASIDRLADEIKAFGGPVYLRIGGEANGPWLGLHKGDFPKAFRKIMERLRDRGADNAVSVYCTEPSAGNDFDDPGWYPGDDVVDWLCIDLFFRFQFAADVPEFANGKITEKGVTERFLQFAKGRKKPVMIAELSPAGIHVTPDPADGQQDWDDWFVPFFAFLAAHQEIKAFYFIEDDWTDNPSYQQPGREWGNARIALNPVLSQNYKAELQKLKYLHTGTQNQLKKP